MCSIKMPSILVQIGHISSRGFAQVLTVISLGLFDHTLDGISDVVGLFFFLWHFDLFLPMTNMQQSSNLCWQQLRLSGHLPYRRVHVKKSHVQSAEIGYYIISIFGL